VPQIENVETSTSVQVRGVGVPSTNEFASVRNIEKADVPTKRTPKLADGCSAVYLDVGSNIGVQVRKLFEPTLYPDAKVHRYFDQYFGNVENRRTPGKVCAFGFEANPVHVPRLKSLEACYNSKGWRTMFIVPRAVSNTDNESLEFFTDSDARNKFWASSIFQLKARTPGGSAVKVQSFDFARFVEDHITGRLLPEPGDVPGPVYVKLDIEGAEYQVLGGLIRTGGLCHLTHASIEFHENFLPAESLGTARNIVDVVKRISSIAPKWYGDGCKPMTLDEMDDETFHTDEKPIPDGCQPF
jgi:hypothetical protein